MYELNLMMRGGGSLTISHVESYRVERDILRGGISVHMQLSDDPFPDWHKHVIPESIDWTEVVAVTVHEYELPKVNNNSLAEKDGV